MQVDTVICGENSEVLKGFPDECIDLTVTSPPYGELRDYKGFKFDFQSTARQIYRVTKQGGVLVWVVGDETKDGDESGESFRQALYFKEIGFNLYDTIIYKKNGFRFPRPRAYHNVFEYMFVLSRGRPKSVNLITDHKNDANNNKSNALPRRNMKREKDGGFTGRKAFVPREYGVRWNVWEYEIGGAGKSGDKLFSKHPAVFPEQLAQDHILSWSNHGDIVLDPFCGSGTTLKMAKEAGRHYIGIDMSEEYCELSRRRVGGGKSPLPQLDTLPQLNTMVTQEGEE